MKKIKISSKLFVKIFSTFIVALILISLILTLLFLHKNFYQTITHAQKIKLLKSEVSITKIDTNLYKKVINSLEKRKQPALENFGGLKDPFQSIE